MDKPFYQTFKKIYEYHSEYLKFDDTAYWFLMAMFIMLLILVYFLLRIIWSGIYDKIDKSTATKSLLYGVLVDKKYKGEESSSGVGTAIIPNTSGGVGVGIVSTHSSSHEEFIFFIQSDKIYKCEVDMQVYYSKSIGDRLGFYVLIGGKSKKELSTSLS